jgi:hypothetical protein
MEINKHTHVSVSIVGGQIATKIPVSMDLTVNVMHTEKELIKLILEYRENLAILRGVKSVHDLNEVEYSAEAEDSTNNS